MDNIEMVSSSNLVCVVCHLKTNTLAQLHRHQTFLHSTEELSLAAISQQITFMNNEFPAKDSTSCSWFNPYKGPAFYFLSARLLDDNNNLLGLDRSVPLDCVMQKKDAAGVKSRSPKAGLRETRRKNNFIRRQQYRRDKNLRASSVGVLDLSLPKKSGKKSKSCNLIETIFHLENQETGTSLDGKKNKKALKKTTKKRKLLDNVLPIKMEPLFLEDGHDEEKVEIPASPETKVSFGERPSGSPAMSLKNEHDEKSIDKDESWNFHGNNEENNKMEEHFPLDAPPLIPLHGHNFSPKPAAVYELQDEHNEEPTKKNKKARKGKPNSFSHGNGTTTSKKMKKSTSKDNKKKNTRNKKWKKSETVDENFDDHTCLDMPQVHEENDVTEKPVDEQVKIPDAGEEFFTNNFFDLSDDGLNLQLDDFEGVTEFPTYPKDMDEYSILVFDPESRSLVWSSFELADDARSPNIDERSQGIGKDIELEISETTLKNNCGNILFDRLTGAKPQQEKNAFYEREPGENETSLDIKDTSADSFCFQRSKRRRTMPDRYVPL